jgi:hypothetical protein
MHVVGLVDWLAEKIYMEKDQKNIIETFLTMDNLVNRIDIVFTFCARPEISIKREYAKGSILRKESR